MRQCTSPHAAGHKTQQLYGFNLRACKRVCSARMDERWGNRHALIKCKIAEQKDAEFPQILRQGTDSCVRHSCACA